MINLLLLMIQGGRRVSRVTLAITCMYVVISQCFNPVCAKPLHKDPVTNIGFMKNPPEAWVKQFPMCNAFLKVKWVDRTKGVGYSVYNLYVNGKKSGKTFSALIFLNWGRPHYDYDVDKWRNEGKLQDIFEGVVKTKDIGMYLSDDMRISYRMMNPEGEAPEISLADHRENVCIPYPPDRPQGYSKIPFLKQIKGQRMWLADIKEVGKVYSKQKIMTQYLKVKQFIHPMPGDMYPGYDELANFKHYRILDLNNDGANDFLVGEEGVGNSTYFYRGKHYQMRPMWKNPSDDLYGAYYYPSSGKTCHAGMSSNFYITTDGKSYYLNNSCNLTDLMR